MKRVFRHLRGTSLIGLMFKRKGTKAIGFIDSCFVGDLDKRSLNGYPFIFGRGLVSW